MVSGKWTDDELEILHRKYNDSGYTAKDIAEELGRSVDSIYNKARSEEIQDEQDPHWSDEEIDFLKRVGTIWKDQEIADYLDRSVPAVRTKKESIDFDFEKQRWSDEEIEILRDIYQEKSDEEIGERLGRTKVAVRCKRVELDLNKRDPHKAWSEDELKYLKENSDASVEELVNALDRSYKSVVSKRSKLGISESRIWTHEEEEFLEKMYGMWTAHEIAEYLDKTLDSVYNKVRQDELTYIEINDWSSEELEFVRRVGKAWKDQEIADYLNRPLQSVRSKKSRMDCDFGKRRWIDKEEEFLQENFPDLCDRELADELDRTVRSVKNRRRRKFGLIRPGMLEDTIWRSWEQLCIMIAQELYSGVEAKPELSNGTYPDLQIGDLVVDAKKTPHTHRVEEDVRNYRSHCGRLEFWCLFGDREFEYGDVDAVPISELKARLRMSDVGEDRKRQLLAYMEMCVSGVDPFKRSGGTK